MSTTGGWPMHMRLPLRCREQRRRTKTAVRAACGIIRFCGEKSAPGRTVARCCSCDWRICSCSRPPPPGCIGRFTSSDRRRWRRSRCRSCRCLCSACAGQRAGGHGPHGRARCRALDILLVTDITPREFILGKLAGVLYNTKEMVLLPMALCVYLAITQQVSIENMIYLLGGWLVMVGFVMMLGVHCGMNYVNSRAAIAVSVGTVFFLFIGVATCMRIMVAFSGSFQFQLQPFLAFMVGGGIGLLVALGLAQCFQRDLDCRFCLPFLTFYALTSFLLNYTLAVLAGRGRGLWLCHGGDAGASDLRVRRRHGTDDRRRRLSQDGPANDRTLWPWKTWAALLKVPAVIWPTGFTGDSPAT